MRLFPPGYLPKPSISPILSLGLLLLLTMLLSSTSSALGRTVGEQNSKASSEPIATQDAYLFLRPSIDTPGSCPAPANGGNTTTGCRFVLDLMLNTGSNRDTTAQQSFLTFTHQLVQNARVDQIDSSCTFTNTVTGDFAIFDGQYHNQVCNGPGSCYSSGVTLGPGSLGFASGGLISCEEGCGGVFRVARIGMCAVAPGQASLQWRLNPPYPQPYDTGIVTLNGDWIQNPALFADYSFTVTGPPVYTPTPTLTPTRTITLSPTSTRTITPTRTPPCGLQWNLVDPAPPGFRTLRDIVALASNDIWAVGYGIEHWNGTQWSLVPDPPYSGNYTSVAASAPNDVWTVGGTLVKHWNGTQWSPVAVPTVGVAAVLQGVTAQAADDAWLVGYYREVSGGPYKALVLHWDGIDWGVMPIPNVDLYSSALMDVWAISPNDVWAVGYYDQPGTNTSPLTIHWDGVQWNIVPSLTITGYYNELHGVTAVSANDVWAVGVTEGSSISRTLTEHWDGTQWSIVPSPTNISGLFNAVAAIAQNDVWAVGANYQGRGSGLTEHWDGTQWSVVPNPGPIYLRGVTAVSTEDVWAVGGDFIERYSNWCSSSTPTQARTITSTPAGTNTPSNTRTVTLTGTPTITHTPTQTFTPTPTPTSTCGVRWHIISSPSIGNLENSLRAVAVVAYNDVWAVGHYQEAGGSFQTLIEHWNGTQWSIEPSSNVAGRSNKLTGIAALSTNDIWAVGYTSDGSIEQTLILHWDGVQWSIVPSANTQPNYDNVLYAVAGVSANDVWAVGSHFSTAINGTGALVEHWDGTQWSIVGVPQPGFSLNVLLGVVTISANDAWAVGYYSNSPSYPEHPLALHWNGASWTRVNMPDPGAGGYQMLYSVTALAANDVWAVGHYYFGTLVVHWNGIQWSIVPSPNLSDLNATLRSVTALSPNDIWAMGKRTDVPLVEHWDGSQWTVVTNPGSGVAQFYGGDALYADHIWAVGDTWVGGGQYQTLTEQYADLCTVINSPTPTFTITLTSTNTPTITGTPFTATPTSTPTITHSPALTNSPTRTLTPSPTITLVPCGANPDYAVLVGSSAIVPGTTDIGNHCDDCLTAIALPFSYTLYDRIFTSAQVSSNGQIGFLVSHAAYVNSCLPDTSTSYTIFPYWDDQLTNGFEQGIFTSISGTAPNRIFNIEWRSCVYSSGSCGQYLNYEVRLYEGQMRFDIIYGSVDQGGASATIGVQKDIGSQYTQFTCNQNSLNNGIMLIFTLAPCLTNTPTATSTPTALLSGHVVWQGPPAQHHALQQLPVTLTLKLGNYEVNLPPTRTDVDGHFTYTMSTLPTGTYNWRAKGPKYLANTGTVSITNAPVTVVDIGLMRTGDSNNDNVVDTSDFAIIHASFGRAASEPGYDYRADFTCNGVISMADFAPLKVNFGQWGAPPIRPGPP